MKRIAYKNIETRDVRDFLEEFSQREYKVRDGARKSAETGLSAVQTLGEKDLNSEWVAWLEESDQFSSRKQLEFQYQEKGSLGAQKDFITISTEIRSDEALDYLDSIADNVIRDYSEWIKEKSSL